MGNHNGAEEAPRSEDVTTRSSVFHHNSSKRNSACLIKLFQKLELTADEQNRHPGELSRSTFENAFHGPLHKFGKLLYIQMSMARLHGNAEQVRERITKEEFVKSGKELMKMFDEKVQQKYYFKLFAGGKDLLNKEDGLQMVNVSYALTLSASNISYSKSHGDDKVFAAIVQSMYGMNESISFDDFVKWTKRNCPHIFCGVHNWVYTILTGSKMPSEQETAPVPQLEKFKADQHCMSMGMLWALSIVLPPSYTHSDCKEEGPESLAYAPKNPLLTSFNLIMKLARLTRCQSWSILYDSHQHGLSQNRFSHHVTSYAGPTVSLVSFEGRNIYCIAEDQCWREGTSRFGRDDTMLLQVTPVFRVIQAEGPMVLWNDHARDLPRGISLGKDPKSLVLFIPADFDKVEHYRVPCGLNKIEVWGCGSSTTRAAQIQQKQWEKKEVEKQAVRKLRLEPNWDENPDKQILQWGGIKVEHQYSH